MTEQPKSRITGGDISLVVDPSTVKRAGFAEFHFHNLPTRREPSIRRFLELSIDGEGTSGSYTESHSPIAALVEYLECNGSYLRLATRDVSESGRPGDVITTYTGDLYRAI